MSTLNNVTTVSAIRTTTTTPKTSTQSLIVAYYALSLIIIGTILNTLTLIILCRPSFKNTKARPIIHYMRAMAIFDILMLYTWNLDHYVANVYHIRLIHMSLIPCKLVTFLSYFAAQSSAWLRVYVCFDRYLSLSRLHRTWFGQSKNALIIMAGIIIILFLLNCHILIFVCFYRPSGTISGLSWLFKIYPLWDYVNLGVYNCAPFLLMVAFNSGVIYHLIHLKRTTMIQNSRIQHRSISITLVITTFMFLIMTIPATVGFAFFSSSDITVLRFLDGLLHTYHIISFPLYMMTFDEFRQQLFSMFELIKINRRIVPQTQRTTGLANFIILRSNQNT